MVKKILVIALSLFFMTGLNAQTESTIAASDILFWVGNGNNSAILVMDFGTNAVAWGYRYDGDKTALNMVSAVDAADPRFAMSLDWMTYDFTGFHYCDYPLHLYMLDTYRMKVDGVLYDVDDELTDVDLENGMLVKIGQSDNSIWSTVIVAATPTTVPASSTIDASQITYWVGTGTDSAVVAINWGVPDTALAWGVLFSGEFSISDAFNAISNADPRLTITNYMASYNDGTVSLAFQTVPSTNTPQFVLDGNGYAGYNDLMHNGSFLKLGESAYGHGIDSCYWEGSGWWPSSVVWSAEIHPVSDPDAPVPPQVEDATIDFSEILYWVGEGNNKVVFAVNWADTALAWGYKFSTDSVSVQTVMEGIAAADPRFSFSGEGWLSDINFVVTTGDTLGAITPGWWMSTLNGNSNASSGMTTMLGNNDFFKWGDYTIAVTVDTVTYAMVFTATVHPVSVPQTQGIANVETVCMSVYPNPVADYVTISGVNGDAVLYDMRGSVVTTFRVSGTETRVNLSTLTSGVYMLRVGNAAAKVVVRH